MKITDESDNRLNPLLMSSIIIVLSVFVLLVINWPVGEEFTEIWLVPGSYPTNISNGEELSFSVGLKNMEGEVLDYELEVLVGGEPVNLYNVPLNNGEQRIIDISTTISENITLPAFVEVDVSGKNSSVRFRIYGYSNEQG